MICHRDLIVHGAEVVRDGLVTAYKSFTPSAPRPPQHRHVRCTTRTSSTTSRRWNNRTVFLPYPMPTTTTIGRTPKQAPAPSEERDQPPQISFSGNCEMLLELQGDTNFTKTGVTNALAREIVLNSARTQMLARLDGCLWETSEDSDRTPRVIDDPVVAEFVSRFKTNLRERQVFHSKFKAGTPGLE